MMDKPQWRNSRKTLLTQFPCAHLIVLRLEIPKYHEIPKYPSILGDTQYSSTHRLAVPNFFACLSSRRRVKDPVLNSARAAPGCCRHIRNGQRQAKCVKSFTCERSQLPFRWLQIACPHCQYEMNWNDMKCATRKQTRLPNVADANVVAAWCRRLHLQSLADTALARGRWVEEREASFDTEATVHCVIFLLYKLIYTNYQLNVHGSIAFALISIGPVAKCRKADESWVWCCRAVAQKSNVELSSSSAGLDPWLSEHAGVLFESFGFYKSFVWAFCYLDLILSCLPTNIILYVSGFVVCLWCVSQEFVALHAFPRWIFGGTWPGSLVSMQGSRWQQCLTCVHFRCGLSPLPLLLVAVGQRTPLPHQIQPMAYQQVPGKGWKLGGRGRGKDRSGVSWLKRNRSWYSSRTSESSSDSYPNHLFHARFSLHWFQMPSEAFLNPCTGILHLPMMAKGGWQRSPWLQ